MGRSATPVFSPDGRRIALTIFKSSSFDVGVFDLERGDLIPITSGETTCGPAGPPTANG